MTRSRPARLGQLGRTAPTGSDLCEEVSCGEPPAPIASGARFEALAVTRLGGCGLTRAGGAVCWGGGEGTPAGVPGPRLTALAAGTYQVCGLDGGRTVRCWSPAGRAPGTAAPEPDVSTEVPRFYFDRLFPNFGTSFCGYNRVSGAVCEAGTGYAVVPGQT